MDGWMDADAWMCRFVCYIYIIVYVDVYMHIDR